jgi:hypothetical protein
LHRKRGQCYSIASSKVAFNPTQAD